MSDIFISYSHLNRDLRQVLAQGPGGRGHSVRWDSGLEGYASFRDLIDASLSSASKVVVNWSEAAPRQRLRCGRGLKAARTGRCRRSGDVI